MRPIDLPAFAWIPAKLAAVLGLWQLGEPSLWADDPAVLVPKP